MPLPLGLEPVKWSMSLRPKPSGKSNQRKCWLNSPEPHKGIYSKDYILALIARYGVACGVGYVVEYRGEAIDRLTMEERMTICNMSIEFGSKMGIMNPDETTFDYLRGRECVPNDFEAAVADWKTLVSDDDAVYDKVIRMDVSDLSSDGDLGTNPSMGVDFETPFPEIRDMNDERAYHYMDLEPGQNQQTLN